MTLPASGAISFFQICDEFGLPHTAVFPRDFYGKGGAPGAGTLSFADFYGRSSVTFDLAPGNYSATDVDFIGMSIIASVPVVWTWTKTPSLGRGSSATPASGGSATEFDCSCQSLAGAHFSDPTQPNGATFNVTATVGGQQYNWTITLNCTGGTAGGGSA